MATPDKQPGGGTLDPALLDESPLSTLPLPRDLINYSALGTQLAPDGSRLFVEIPFHVHDSEPADICDEYPFCDEFADLTFEQHGV